MSVLINETNPADEPTHFGTGWISGVLSVALGSIGLGAVFCFLYPSLLTMPELRDLYPIPYIRALHHIVLIGSVVLGALNMFLRTSKVLGLIGISLALTAMFLGGSTVQINEELTD